MAITSSVPPQAYTRDTLVKAIEWLSTQPQTVRERANSADTIVSHYLHACRRTTLHVETPVSPEAFKSDLKQLAANLKQFEQPSMPPPTRPVGYGPELLRHETTTRQETIVRQESRTEEHSSSTTLQGGGWQIDARSLGVCRELQERLNLSNEGEAIRMLITLGAERARQLFP